MSNQVVTEQKNIGWECPSCGSCYSPWVDRCKRCGNEAKIAGGLGRPERYCPDMDHEKHEAQEGPAPEEGTFIPLKDKDALFDYRAASRASGGAIKVCHACMREL